MLKRNFVFIILALFIGCQKNVPEAAHEHANETAHVHAITQWTENYEVFAELPILVANEHADVAVHVTSLADFQPLAAGNVQVEFENEATEAATTLAAELTKPGIFLAHVELADPGEYHVHILLRVDGAATEVEAGHLDVFADDAAAEAHLTSEETEADEHAHEEALQTDEQSADGHDHTGLIKFTKEQQWQTDFATAVAQEREMSASILAFATVTPHQQGYAEVIAPVDGFLDVQLNQNLAAPGVSVKKGDVLAILSPPIGGANTIVQRVLSYERAKKDFERAKNLLQRDAISQREYEQIEKIYLLEKTTYETLAESYGLITDDSTHVNQFELRAPISGIVSSMDVLPGQNLTAGQKMMTVIDPSKVWLRAELFERDFYQLDNISGLSVTIQSTNQKLNFSQNEFKLLSKGQQLNPETRTIPVLFQVNNLGQALKIGQFVQAEIYTAEHKKSLAVPLSAVMDEEINKIVYVQTGGESFAQRVVQTGPVSRDWITITSGLHAGERVVVRGAYAVKLASTNVAVGHGHVH